ncbi:MAG: 6-phosphogluconolactonase [Desulfuromonadales bacterium]|nr:6-phosphogluconolactonase [Desulfuromonadales bacterium]
MAGRDPPVCGLTFRNSRLETQKNNKQMPEDQHITWHRLADSAAVARDAAVRIQQAADEAIAQRGTFRLVLAGGRTPEATYRLLADTDADWPHWEIYFGDERCLPADHADRNDTMAARAWLDHVDIPRQRIHIIPAGLGPTEGALRYAAEISAALPFDLVILGLGVDGHTASLFPGHDHPEQKLVVPVTNAPKPPSERISLSAKALSQTRQVLVLVTGKEKRHAVARWKAGENIPIAGIVPSGPLEILLDLPV